MKILKKIILFGSFARGDQKEKSDIDLAFEFDQRPENWPVFKSCVDDYFQTLRELDLVILDEADDSIIESIQKEEIIYYEQ
ncbi:MAG: nucleotidyltransferase domain-containing protein [Halobacteriovoraceae bacterium]|nr:nucleotidyltransferase domain-containing protein [Halobacteriovoraceae bacterium]